MIKQFLTLNVLALAIAFVLLHSQTAGAQTDTTLSRIAFGSCAKQDNPQPIWKSIYEADPDLFLFIGDNIYGDTTDMKIMQQKWDKLAAVPDFARLRTECQIMATWDDHDYGANDGGVEFVAKKESQKVFLDFFNEPKDSPRRKQEGIYDAKLFGPEERRVQIILLDTRYFRSPLVKSNKTYTYGSGIHGPYAPNNDPESTVLGEAQWEWLEKQLTAPAKLRIIASSIQLISDDHWWEKWGNFPHERQRMFSLIEKTKAGGVMFISGDRHRAEVSRTQSKLGYPVYDFTSSSLNQPQPWRNELNAHRVGSLYVGENFGTFTIDWTKEDPVVTTEIRDITGKSMIEIKHPISELQPRSIDDE